jgi:SAM-dependent methyltransferase
MTLVHKCAERPCPITGDLTVLVLHHQRFVLASDNPLPSAYDVVWSSRGGFAYADTPAEQAVYDQYYAARSKYDDDATSTGGGVTPSDLERIKRTAAEIIKVVPNRQAKIVDIGCAKGGLLLALQSLGCESLFGVDPSLYCIDSVRRRGIEAAVGGIFSLPISAGNAEMVLLSHVLEHIYDLKRAVRALADTLKSEAILYVEVPDAARYRDFIVAPFQDFNTEHINHFSLVSLRNLLLSQGFEFISAGTRTVDSTPGCPYPILFAFFRKGAGLPVADFEYQTDEGFFQSIQDYTFRSGAKLQLMETRISRKMAPHASLIVWGTGELTMKLLAETSLRDANIVAFVDGNPVNQGKTLLGRRIYAPSEVERFGASHSILIATLLHQEAITRTIREDLGLTNQIVGLN